VGTITQEGGKFMSSVTFPKCANCGGDLMKPIGEIDSNSEITCSGCPKIWSYGDIRKAVLDETKKSITSELQKGLKGLKIVP